MKVFLRLLLVIAVFIVANPGGARADSTPSPAPSPAPSASADPVITLAHDRLLSMLQTGHADPAWFTDSFLAQVPAAKLDEILASIKGQLGDVKSVDFAQTKFVAHFANGSLDALIHLDAQKKIDGLVFRPA